MKTSQPCWDGRLDLLATVSRSANRELALRPASYAPSCRAKRGPCCPRLFKPTRGPRVDAHRSIGWPTIGRRPADWRFPVFRSTMQPRDGPSHAGRLARALGCISFPRSLAHFFLHCRDKLLESERFCEEIIFVFLALREVLLEGLLSVA
jgi:hypothetical protein